MSQRVPRRPAVSLALIALGAAAAAVPLAAAAQPSPRERHPGVTVAVAASGLYSNLSRAADVGRDGFGFDAGTYLGVSDFALGAGYQRIVHANGPARSGVYEGVFVEPRVSLPLGVPFTPYVAGRLVRLTPVFAGAGHDDGRPRGVQVGGGGGVLVALAPRLRLDLGATVSRMRRDDPADATRPGAGRADVAQARVGLVYGVGRWTRER